MSGLALALVGVAVVIMLLSMGHDNWLAAPQTRSTLRFAARLASVSALVALVAVIAAEI